MEFPKDHPLKEEAQPILTFRSNGEGFLEANDLIWSRWANHGQPFWLDTIRHGRLGISHLEILAGQEPKEIVEPQRLVAWIVRREPCTKKHLPTVYIWTNS